MGHSQLLSAEKLKKALHITIHILHLLIPSLAIVAAAHHAVGERGNWPPATVFLFTYTLIIAIFLYTLEAYVIWSKAHRYPEFVYKSLNFLTTLGGRALFYQFLGALYIIAYPSGRWACTNYYTRGWDNGYYGYYNRGYYHTIWANETSRVLGLIIWGIGTGVFLVDTLARAYHFTSWVWHEPKGDEGQLRLESDGEKGGDY